MLPYRIRSMDSNRVPPVIVVHGFGGFKRRVSKTTVGTLFNIKYSSSNFMYRK